MTTDRLERVRDRLAVHRATRGASIGTALCVTGTDVLGIAGVGLTLHGPNGAPYSIGVSGPDMQVIHGLELTLGEGPCIDAFTTGLSTSEPDLRNPATVRWPGFSAEAGRTGARAAFGYPLQRGTVRFGALNLYETHVGPLSDDQHQDALALAEVSVATVLDALETDPTGDDMFGTDDAAQEIEVHQATGMVSVQLGVALPDALARLRARAFAEGRSVVEVAGDVVNRRIRLEP